VLRGTNLLAIASLIGAFVFPPAGLVCGLIAKSQIRRTGEEGDGLATAGIIISVIAIVLWIVAFGSIMSTQHQMVHDFNNFGPGSP
jgi:hypothetical protein